MNSCRSLMKQSLSVCFAVQAEVASPQKTKLNIHLIWAVTVTCETLPFCFAVHAEPTASKD